jgi:hypothetical protein
MRRTTKVRIAAIFAGLAALLMSGSANFSKVPVLPPQPPAPSN